MGSVVIGAFIGGFTAAVRGGNPIKGMVLGAAGGYIKSAILGGAAGEAGGLAAGEAGGYAAGAEALTAEAAGAAAGGAIEGAGAETLFASALPEAVAAGEVASAAAPVFETAGSEMAASTLEGAIPVESDIAGSVVQQGGVAPSAPVVDVPGEGAGRDAYFPSTNVSDPVLWQKVKKWAEAHPQIAAAVIQAGGSAIGGIGAGAGKYLSEQQKADLELRNKKALIQYYRDFEQSGSTGGKGVNLGVNAPATPRPLRTQGGGLVRRAMIV